MHNWRQPTYICKHRVRDLIARIPIPSIVTTQEIAEAMKEKHILSPLEETQFPWLSVFSKSQEERLQEDAHTQGTLSKESLKTLQQKHQLIGDVCGIGLHLEIELIKDRNTKIPAKEEASEISEKCKEMGLLLDLCGIHGNTLAIYPPMCITEQDVNFAILVLDTSFEEIKKT